MRLTRAGEYAVRCMIYLSAQPLGRVVSRKEISEKMDVPCQFLTKIAQQLVRANILESIQGSKGGLKLLIKPDDVNLLDVVEAVMGKISLNDCIANPDSCSNSPMCSVHQVWARATDQLNETLSAATFAQLVSQWSCLLKEKGTGPG